MLTSSAFAKVHYLNLEGKRMPYQRDSMLPGVTEWGYEVSLNMKVSMSKVWLESDLTGQSHEARFRNMWWDYTLGYSIIPELDLVWDHQSQHALDWEIQRYDVRDSYGIRLNFIKE